MAAVKQNFSIFQGDNNVLIQFTITDAAGTPVDVSLASFTWAFSRSAKVPPLVTKTLGTGIALSDPLNGQIQVNMLAADTNTLSGNFFHELVMGLGSKTETVTTGTMTVNDSTIK